MRLYKYKSVTNIEQLEHVIESIRSLRMYMPTRDQLNDPLEGINDLSFGFAGSSYYAETYKMPPQYEDALSNWRILSLSEKEDSMVMWAHYASTFCGVCFVLNNLDTLSEAVKIQYSNKPPQVDEINGFDFEAKAKGSLLQKPEEWCYEQEFRFLQYKKEFIQLNHTDIEKLYLGYRLPPEIMKILYTVCTDNRIRAEVSYVNPYSYKINNVSYDDFLKQRDK